MSGNTTFKLNGSQMVRGVRRLARKQPDRVSGCLYYRSGPDCIIGHALAEQIGTIGLRQLANVAFRVLIGDELILRSERYLEWLAEVQYCQDNGKTWAEAVARADQKLGKVW